MKRLLSIVCLAALLSSSSALAHHKSVGEGSHKHRDYWNPITVHNFAPYAVYYSINNDVDYLLDRNETDIYHSGVGDQRAFIVFRGCSERNPNGECVTYISHMLPDYYNAEKIATINIKSVLEADITCVDGTTTSCVIK